MLGQMVAVLTLSFTLLLTILTIIELRDNRTVLQAAEDPSTLKRLLRIIPIIESAEPAIINQLLKSISSCHDGYSMTEMPYVVRSVSFENSDLRKNISESLSIPINRISMGYTTFKREHFSYASCGEQEIIFPLEGVVISVQLNQGNWLNMEVHPHEWHFTPSFSAWLFRSGLAFLIIGFIAVFFLHRVSAPLRSLTKATSMFDGEKVVPKIAEKGPPDVKNAIMAFNQMQARVTQEMQNRLTTFAAINHDLRTPLTALRVRSELIEEETVREDVISSIKKMEVLATSALEFLREESMKEPLRKVSISSLVESECAEFEDIGTKIEFHCDEDFQSLCYPNSLARAVRNLIENSAKYATNTVVSLQREGDILIIAISDTGPGIPPSQFEQVTEPFKRLSTPKNNGDNGFGLGLTIASSIAKGHGGTLTLSANDPSGLIASIQLPLF